MKRKLFNAALFAAVLVAAPVSTFVSCADYDSDIENLQNQKNDLEALLLQKEQVLNDKIAALEAENDALEAAYKAADAALTQALADNKTEILGEIATCKAECEAAIKNLQGQIDALKKSLGELQEKHDKDVKTLLEADKVLQQNIDAANTAIENLETRLNTRIEALETLTATHSTEIAALQEALKEVKADIEKVRKEFADADKALEDKLQGKIDDLWKQVNANKDAIEKEVTARENAIKELTKVVNDNKKACDDAVKELQAKDTELAGLIQTLTNDFNAYKDFNDAEVKDLKARMAAVEGQVSVNTKAILDLAARVADLYNGLDQLEAALEAAKAALEAADAAQDALIDKLIAEKADKSELTAAVNTLTAKINEVAGDLAKLIVRVNKNEGDIVTLQSQLRALRSEFDEAVVHYNTEIEKLWANDESLKDAFEEADRILKDNIDAVEEAYKTADEEIWAKLGKLDKAISDLKDLVEQYAKELSAEVKGFVLVPDNYYEGIQAIEGDVYMYNPWNVEGSKPTFDAKNFIEFCPEVVANYNVNPSTATLSEDTQYYSYTVEDRKNRGNNEELLPVIKEVKKDGGLLTVHMSITDPTKNQTPSNLIEQKISDKVTVMALQYENPAAKDSAQVVTSDYAALYLNELIGVEVLDRLDGGKHLADLSGKKPLTHPRTPSLKHVNYLATQSIEELIETKFGDKDATTTLPEGFSYRYSMTGDITYFNKTDLEKGIVNPQLDNEKEATVACIGKKIRVRIDVMNGDNIAEVGFIDFAVIGNPVVEFADSVETTANYHVVCLQDVTANALQVTLSADNVWNKVKEVTGEELDKLKKEYSFVQGNGALKQYTKEGETLTEGGVGTVVLNDNGTLTWTITYGDLNGQLPPLTTYVLVRSNEQIYNETTYNEFYLPLSWNPNIVEEWGKNNDGVETAKWTYDKISNEWQTRADGGQEIRIYANLTEKGQTSFVYELSNALYNSKVELHNATNFKNYKDIQPDVTKGKFIFIDLPEAYRTMEGVSRKKYTLSVSEDGQYLMATSQPEVETRAESVNQVSEKIAKITAEGEISLYNNYVTHDLLNKFEKNELDLGQTLAARVNFAVTSCAGEVEVTEGDFYVRFIKPITIGNTTITIVDAAQGTEERDLVQTLVCFNGDTLDKIGNGSDTYFSIFGVQISVPEPQYWKTDYNGSDIEKTTIGEFSKLVDRFGYNKQTHTITYTNAGNVVSEFNVTVPVTYSYIWGNEKTYDVTISIKKTQANSNRK